MCRKAYKEGVKSSTLSPYPFHVPILSKKLSKFFFRARVAFHSKGKAIHAKRAEKTLYPGIKVSFPNLPIKKYENTNSHL